MEELKMQNNLLMQLVKTLQDQINMKDKQNQSIFHQYEQLLKENQIFQTEIEGYRSQIRELKRGSVSNIQSQGYQTSQLTHRVESQVKELRRRLVEDTDNIQMLQNELGQKTHLLGELQVELQRIRGQFGQMQKEAKLVLSLREANKKMEKALKINSQENNRLNEQINAMKEDLQNLAKEREYRQFNEVSFVEKQEMIRQLVEKVEELKDASTKSEIHQGIDEFVERIGQLQANLQQKEIIIGQLYERIANQEAGESFATEQFNSKVAEYQRQISNLRQTVSSREQDVVVLSQLNSKIGNYETQIGGLQQAIANKDEYIRTLDQFSDEQCMKNREMQDQVQQLKSALAQADERQILSIQIHNQKVVGLQQIIRNKDSSIVEQRESLQFQIDQVNGLKEQLLQLKTTKPAEVITEQHVSSNNSNEQMLAALQTKAEELANAQVMVKEKEDELRRMKQTIIGKDQMLQNLRRMVEKQSLQLKTMQKAKKEEEIQPTSTTASQDSTIQGLKDVVEGQKQRIEELQSALVLSNQSHNTCRQRVQELDTLVSKKDQLIAELIASLNDPKTPGGLQSQNAHDSAARTSQILQKELYETMEVELQGRLREKKQMMSQMELLAQQRYMELDNIKTELREKQLRKKELQEEMQSRQQLLEEVSRSIASLSEEAQHLKSQIQIRQKQKESLEDAFSQRQAAAISLQATIKAHEDKITKLGSIQSQYNRYQLQLQQSKRNKSSVLIRQQLPVQALQSELQALQAEKEEQMSGMMTLMETLQEQIRSKDQAIDSLTEQIQQLRSNGAHGLQPADSKEGELRLQLLNQRAECSLLQRQVKELQQENELLKQNVGQLKVVISPDNDELRRQLLQQRGELSLLEREVKELQQENTQLRGNIPQRQQSESPQYKQLRMQLLQQRGEYSLLERQVQQLQDEIASLRQKGPEKQGQSCSGCGDLRRQLLNQRGEYSLLQREMKQLQEQNVSLRSSLPQRQLQACQGCGELRRQLLNQRGEYSLLQRELKQLQEQLASVGQAAVPQQQQLSNETEYKKLRMQLLQLRGEYSLLQRQMKWLQEENVQLKQAAPRQQQQVCNGCEALRRQLLNQRGEYSLLQRQFKQLQEQHASVAQTVVGQKQQLSDEAEYKKLRMQLLQLRGEYSLLQREMKWLQEENAQLKQTAPRQQQQVCSGCDALRRQLLDQSGECSLLQRQLQELEKEIESLRQNVTLNKTQDCAACAKLRQQLVNLRGDYSVLDGQLRYLSEDRQQFMQELRIDSQEQKRQYDELQGQLLQQKQQNSLLESQLKQLQNKTASQNQNAVPPHQQLSNETEYKKLRMQLLQLRGEYSLLQRQIKWLQEENEQLKQRPPQQLAAGSEQTDELRRQLLNQRAEYTLIERQLQQLSEENASLKRNVPQQKQQESVCSGCNSLRLQLLNQRGECSLLQRQLKELQEENESLRGNSGNIQAVQEQSESPQYRQLRMQLLQQRGEYSLLERQVKQLQEENALLRQKQVPQQQELSDEPVYKQLRMQLLQQRRECSLLERQVKQLQEENAELKQKVVEMSERLSKQQHSGLQQEYAIVEMEQGMLQKSQRMAEKYRQELQQMEQSEQIEHDQSEDSQEGSHLTAAQTLEQLLIYSKEGQNIQSIRQMIGNLRTLYEKELQGLQHENSDLKLQAAQLILFNNTLTSDVDRLQQELTQKQNYKNAIIEELQRNMREVQERFSRQILELKSSRFDESPIVQRQEASVHHENGKDEMEKEKEVDVIRELKQEMAKIKRENKVKDEEIAKLKPNFAKQLNDLLADSLINNEEEKQAFERVTAERDELTTKCQEHEEQIKQMEQQNQLLRNSVEQTKHRKANQNKEDLKQRQLMSYGRHEGELTDRAYQKTPAEQNRHSRSYDHHAQQEAPFYQQPFEYEEMQFSLVEKNEIIAELESTILQIEKGFNAETMSLRRNIAELNNQIIVLRKKLYESNPHAIGLAELIKGSFAQQKSTEFYKYDFPKYSQSHFTAYPQVNQSQSSYRTEDRRTRNRIKTEFVPNRELTLGEKIIGRKCWGGPFAYSRGVAVDLNTNSIRVDESQWQSRLPA